MIFFRQGHGWALVTGPVVHDKDPAQANRSARPHVVFVGLVDRRQQCRVCGSMVYACQRQEWLRAALLLGLIVASTGYHYVTEAQYDDTAWTLADHILSSVTAVAVALSWPLSRNKWPLACGVNVCNAVAVGCVAGDVLKEGCVAGSFVLVSLVLGARRVRLVLQHTSKILLGLVAATVVMAGVVIFAYNFGDTLLHGFWHLDTALLFFLLLKTGAPEFATT